MPAITFPEAFLLTFTTYGTWLHGDERGSVSRVRAGASRQLDANPQHQRLESLGLSGPPVTLSIEARAHCTETIKDVCLHRGWALLAVNVRTNHVHVVLRAPERPEKMMSDLKAWCTRRLREHAHFGPSQVVWTRHGSTRYLYKAPDVTAACRYVIDGQGGFRGTGEAGSW